VPLPARLKHPETRTGSHCLFAEQRTQFTGENIEVFIFAVMSVQCREQRTRRDRPNASKDATGAGVGIAAMSMKHLSNQQANIATSTSRHSKDELHAGLDPNRVSTVFISSTLHYI
jgi:hypothetical protein